jgi:hypothetical protein
MSFPSNNTLNQAVKQLKEVVARHQGEDHETNAMVREIEAIVLDIERKAVGLTVGEHETPIAIPPNVINNSLPII